MSKKASNPLPITCMANGYINGGMCGFIVVGGGLCGLPEDQTCMHQKKITKPDPPPAPPAKI